MIFLKNMFFRATFLKPKIIEKQLVEIFRNTIPCANRLVRIKFVYQKMGLFTKKMSAFLSSL